MRSINGLYIHGKLAEAWMVQAAIQRVKDKQLRQELESFLEQAGIGKEPAPLSREAERAFRAAYYEVLMSLGD